MVCPVVDFTTLPERDLEVIERFLMQRLRGLDRKHDRRLRWLARKLLSAAPGEVFELEVYVGRHGGYHRMHRKVLQRLFDAQDRYYDIDALHDWLKVRCVHVDWVGGKPVPASTSYRKCDEARMREFHNKMVELLHDPYVQRHLFPAVRAQERPAMVEAVLNPPQDTDDE
jgi:hypothetical protein